MTTQLAPHATTRALPPDPVLRLAALVDGGVPDLVHEADGSGVQVARGHALGTPVIAFATDSRVSGGALGEHGCTRIAAAIDEAVATGRAVIGLWHSGGARLAEGVRSLDGVGRMFAAMVRASGRVPQITVVLGAAAGGAAYGSALTDLVVMAPEGRVFVTGPDVIRSVTGEVVDQESLGGPDAHGRSGVTHVVAASQHEALTVAAELAGLLSRRVPAGEQPSGEPADPAAFLPERRARAYDVRPVVRALLDPAPTGFRELQARWAPNVVIGFGRLLGRPVGVIASNPLRMGGCLDSAAAEKAARFVRLCDAFGVPLLVLVDVPGYLPGVDEEWGGVVRRGAKLLHAFAEATVPRVTVVLRKAFGGAYVAMNSRSLGATAVFAWPEAEIAVMGARAAVQILHRRLLAETDPAERESVLDRLAADHVATSGGLGAALEHAVVDEVIEPVTTRARVAAVLCDASRPAAAPHGNIPL